tara:strand:+ start:517 stop:2553 length:2037 start_codon:yes stop_codon:yes gene_type:complete
MAVTLFDAQGRPTRDPSKAVRKELRNPGLFIPTSLPGEGELFLLGGSNDPKPALAVRQGGGFTILGAAPGKGQADVGGALSALGIDRSKLSRFSTDIGGGERGADQGLIKAGEQFDPEFFRQFNKFAAPQQLSRTEDPEAIAASLDPSSPENVAARAAAAQRFGQPGGTVQAAGFDTSAPADSVFTEPVINFKEGLSQEQQDSITNLLKSNRAFTETDARNYAFAIGESNFQQFIGKKGENFPRQAPDGSESGMATLTSPNGSQKTVVRVGSQQASDLLSSGWTLGTSETATFIDSTALEDVEEIKTDGINDDKFDTPPPESALGVSEETIKQIDEDLQADTEATRKEDELGSDLMTLLGQLEGKEEFRQQQLDQEFIEENKKNLQKIRNELKIKTAAYQKRLAEIDATPMTLLRQGGAMAAATRVQQADIMFLNSMAQTYMDNISFARELAQDAVDAKYDPILEQIDIKKQQFELISDIADKDQKRYTTALNIALDRQAEEAANAKAQEQAINDIVLSYIDASIKAKKTPDSNVINQIRNAGSEGDAIEIFGTNAPIKAPSGPGPGPTGEEFTQAQLMDPFIQDLARKFDAGTISESSMSKTDFRKVQQILNQRKATAAAFPEADIFQDPVANFRFSDDAFVGVSDEDREKMEEYIEIRRSQGLSDGEIFIELGGEL